MASNNFLRNISYPDQWIVNKETPTEALAREKQSLDIIEQLREQEELYALGKVKQTQQIAENLKPVTDLLGKSLTKADLTNDFLQRIKSGQPILIPQQGRSFRRFFHKDFK